MLKVNPTRINLLKLKKELKTAQKGYKLLKEKRDGLMSKFMEVIKNTRDTRELVEKKLGGAFRSYVRASSVMSPKMIDVAFMVPNAKVSLDVSTQNVMSVAIPRFELHQEGRAFSYGFMETSGDLDNAVSRFEDALADIVKLAELEKTVENLAAEIEVTRRRVSALENTRIPAIKSTIRKISQRLEEQARDATVSTMRVKSMIEAKEQG